MNGGLSVWVEEISLVRKFAECFREGNDIAPVRNCGVSEFDVTGVGCRVIGVVD